jgi:molecular chaperone GrpE
MQEQKEAEQQLEGGGTAEGNAPEAAQTQPNLQELLQKAEQAAQEHREAWLRAKADAENIRRRAQTDIANAHKYALENFAGELLAVRDSLEAALATGNSAVETLRSGVELTLKQLSGAFEKAAIRQINPMGEKFDPHRHQSISMVEADAEPNTVIAVLQKGYSLHERVIRPALVSLAKPRSAPEQ